MFILREFIIDNLKKCVESGVFSKAQAGIFALNYFNKGQISAEDFEHLATEFSKEDEVNEEQEVYED